MIPLWAFCVRPSMFDGSFVDCAFSFPNVTSATTRTADFIRNIGLALDRNLVFPRLKVSQLRCLENSLYFDLFLCIKEFFIFFRKTFTRFSPVQPMYGTSSQIHFIAIIFLLRSFSFRRFDKPVNQSIGDTFLKSIPGCQFLHKQNSLLEVFTVTKPLCTIYQHADTVNLFIKLTVEGESSFRTCIKEQLL